MHGGSPFGHDRDEFAKPLNLCAGDRLPFKKLSDEGRVDLVHLCQLGLTVRDSPPFMKRVRIHIPLNHKIVRHILRQKRAGLFIGVDHRLSPGAFLERHKRIIVPFASGGQILRGMWKFRLIGLIVPVVKAQFAMKSRADLDRFEIGVCFEIGFVLRLQNLNPLPKGLPLRLLRIGTRTPRKKDERHHQNI